MKIPILSSLFFICASIGYGQVNLVENGGFEDISGKLKSGAKVDIAAGWYSLSAAGADIFCAESKDELMKTPDNAYGREKPYSGNNYAGIVAYSYQSKEPRSYVTTTLASPLEAGKTYCVQFYVSLSDLSKFAVNNIGAHLTDREYNMADSKEPLLVEANIKHSKNKIIETSVYWEPICGIYTAKGGERFLTIGNFSADNATSAKKMKKAPQFKQAQVNTAFYFIDEVSVKLINDASACECEKQEFVDVPKVIYKRQESNVSAEEMTEEITTMKIQFDSLSSALTDEAQKQIGKLSDILKTKSTLSIVVIGHSSDREADLAKRNPKLNTLSAERAKAVVEAIVKTGVVKTRTKAEGVKNSQPFVYGNRPEDHLANCAVHIEILTE
ncbi:MAG TPA: OmpA family protein [Luteibaculaceae bacterium]|nr:OmpA family protein [Luteibaculaceae bacterium]